MIDLTVADVMHPGIHTAGPDTTITELAAMMAERGIHCVVIEGVRPDRSGERLVWGVVSDRDLLSALHAGGDATAGQIALTEAAVVARQAGLDEAVTLRVEHDLSHVIVVDETDGRPAGVLSSLDVARAVADGARVEA
jgi:CBS domain-containing protein